MFPKIIDKVNFDEGMFLQYTSYEKKTKVFNQKGGIFTRHAIVTIKRRLEGYTLDHEKFLIYDCKMATNSGKSQQTHFDGIYIVLCIETTTKIQIKSKGSPKEKGVKFYWLKDVTDFKVYKSNHIELTNTYLKYLEYVKSLEKQQIYKRIYLSVLKDEVHLALQYYNHPARKKATITRKDLNELVNYFLHEVKLAEQLSAIEQY